MNRCISRAAMAALVIVGLQRPSAAEPPVSEPASPTDHDPGAAPWTKAAQSPTPWIDQGSSPISEAAPPPGPPDRRLAAGLTLGGLYAGFATWTYFAWYRKHKPLAEFKVGGDDWFGANTYAGGADKLGHAWATMGLARVGTEMLHQWGGFGRLTSTIVSATLAELLFLGIEVKDGFYYELSIGDAVFNTIGALTAVAMSLSPRLDELFDFRVEYWPSQEYRRQFRGGNVNIAEDYTGETYVLAFHLGGIAPLREASWGGWSRFVDLAIGYGSRGYKPDPPEGIPDYAHRQELSIGLSLNLQGVSDWLFERRSRPAYKIGHALFEVFNAGYLPAVEWERSPTGAVAPGGA